ncbi:DUF1836 domain-containing protein [Streptococcus oricebi]|uniref:DUF1836 domain-containing protein n=1 Tax=Streptococcus oricebi TaxID=1547447 RepID=A0ABS5B0N4_9STRE|nr:DUF1836 domain-containing protein [Streptococcus oricebi]MBP2622393.1 hypothetical protein [Streptococcus oricebi]
MTSFSFPKWEDLPELDLYLDQVLLYVNQINNQAFEGQEKALTASMVNNYVKHGHLPKPIKKKYSRHQVARLIILTALKPVFSIQDIILAVQDLVTKEDLSAFYYNDFVACMQGEEPKSQHHPLILSACQTIKVYHQTQTLFKQLEGGSSNETSQSQTK